MTILAIAIFITFLLGIGLALLLVTGRSTVSARLMKVAGAEGKLSVEPRDRISKVMQFFPLVTAPIRRFLGIADNSEVAGKLAAARYRRPEAVEMFYATKMCSPVLAALVAGFIIRKDVFFWFVVLTVAAFFLLDFWLSGAIGRRRTRIRLGLPDALDLLVVCMEAGLGMDQALMHVGSELKISHPDLSDEFKLINLEQRTGKPRIDAWRNMAERTNLETVHSFANMLVQGERFGTPISRSLSTFADTLRTKRRQAAEQQAAKTTVKLIFPLVLFIFPSMLIVLLAPAMISITRNLGKFFE